MLCVKWSLSDCIRSDRSVDLLLLAIDCMYKLINQVNEYWYMGSILARSDIQKNKIDECAATGW